MENEGDHRRKEKKDDRHRADENELDFGRLSFDDRDESDLRVVYLAQIFRHGRRHALSNENNDHCCERDNDPIPPVLRRTQNPPHSGMNDIGREIVYNLAQCHPKKRFYEKFRHTFFNPPLLPRRGFSISSPFSKGGLRGISASLRLFFL